MERPTQGFGSQKRQRAGAVQKLTHSGMVPSGAKRLGLRQPSGALRRACNGATRNRCHRPTRPFLPALFRSALPVSKGPATPNFIRSIPSSIRTFPRRACPVLNRIPAVSKCRLVNSNAIPAASSSIRWGSSIVRPDGMKFHGLRVDLSPCRWRFVSRIRLVKNSRPPDQRGKLLPP